MAKSVKSVADLDAEYADLSEKFKSETIDLNSEKKMLSTLIEQSKKRVIQINRIISSKHIRLANIKNNKHSLLEFIKFVEDSNRYTYTTEYELVNTLNLTLKAKPIRYARTIKNDDGILITYTFTPLNVSFSIKIIKDINYFMYVELDNPDTYSEEFKTSLQTNAIMQILNTGPFNGPINAFIGKKIDLGLTIQKRYDIEIGDLRNPFRTFVKVLDIDTLTLSESTKLKSPTLNWYIISS